MFIMKTPYYLGYIFSGSAAISSFFAAMEVPVSQKSSIKLKNYTG